VARRFRGESHHKVDAKGRVSIPALFRRVLEAGDPDWRAAAAEGRKDVRPQLVIVYGGENQKYLECYTIDAIDEVDAEIDAMPRGSPERRLLEHLFHGQSLPTEVDRDGRLVLPQKLREKIGLEGEAFFIASGDTFKIWKPETYERVELAKTRAFLAEQPDDFDPLSLLGRAKGE